MTIESGHTAANMFLLSTIQCAWNTDELNTFRILTTPCCVDFKIPPPCSNLHPKACIFTIYNDRNMSEKCSCQNAQGCLSAHIQKSPLLMHIEWCIYQQHQVHYQQQQKVVPHTCMIPFSVGKWTPVLMSCHLYLV